MRVAHDRGVRDLSKRFRVDRPSGVRDPLPNPNSMLGCCCVRRLQATRMPATNIHLCHWDRTTEVWCSIASSKGWRDAERSGLIASPVCALVSGFRRACGLTPVACHHGSKDRTCQACVVQRVDRASGTAVAGFRRTSSRLCMKTMESRPSGQTVLHMPWRRGSVQASALGRMSSG